MAEKPKEAPQTAKTAPLIHLLNQGRAALVTFEDDILILRTKSGETTETVRATDIVDVQVQGQAIINRMTVRTKQGRSITINGLDRATSQALQAQLHTRVEELLNNEAASDADTLRLEILELAEKANALLNTDRHVRHSATVEFRDAVHLLGQRIDSRTRQKLEGAVRQALNELEAAADAETLEKRRQELNEAFLAEATDAIQGTTGDMFPRGLTAEQAAAIATDEDTTLVLAGAGTGKTAVVTGKIAHLVRNKGIPLEAILALAFNRKAALEIRDRLPEDLKGSQVSTFHSFALKVVASQGTAPTISKLAQDDFAYSKSIDGILGRMARDADKAKLIIQMVTGTTAEYRAPFDYDTPREYEQYVRDAELRTLNGELVKSFEELTLANFLAAQGVRYTYERPYEFLTATQEFRQYQPDFFLPEHGIYIEHFALNEQGQAPEGWSRYVEEARWKRETHKEHGTKLIETYSWQFRKGTLESTLEQKLQDEGVTFKPVPPEELVKRLSSERLSRLSHLLGTFLTHVKSSNLDHEEILARAKGQKDKDRAKCFLEIFRDVREGYEKLLQAENAVDFHDLINKAAAIIADGSWVNPFQYVLIDEFQDISNGRMNLAKALRKPGMAYFLVGDDWQSIYRFAGSYVGLIHQTADHLGFTQQQTLTTTFRFGDGVLRPSTGFVQQNPEQTNRQLHAHSQEGDQGITVMPADLPETGLHEALREIEETRESPQDSVLVLGRYRASRRILGQAGRNFRNVQFNTVHSTKGQEADYVIVLDLKDDQYGFPCKVEDDPLLAIVMPPTHGDPFPFAEERRLFYVALTRARKGVYLITDPVRPSPFVRELVKNCPEVKVKDGLRPQCPECDRGSLIPSQSGENLRCSNFPRCQHRAPRCPNCRRGYVNRSEVQPECSNPACESPPRTCPRCQTGILLLRTGRSSSFWGCSMYQGTPQCNYTERASEAEGAGHSSNGSRPTVRGRRRRTRYSSRH